MAKKLEPTIAEIPEIDAKASSMKMRCTGKGEALWAQFQLLYPVIITSRSFLGRLANGAGMDCEIMAVKVDGKMHEALPSHVGPGNLDIILQAKDATGIEVCLSCRIEPQTAGEAAEVGSVADAVERLGAEPRPEDPDPPPPPTDPRETARRIELESVDNTDQLSSGGPFPMDLTPDVAAQATESLQNLLTAKDLTPAVQMSIEAFVDADGDPTAMLRADTEKRRRELEPA